MSAGGWGGDADSNRNGGKDERLVTSLLGPGWSRSLLRGLSLVGGLALIFGVGVALSPQFLTIANQRDVFEQVSLNGLLAIGMTLVILTAGIDLSVGSTLSLCSVVCAMLVMPVLPADQIALAAIGLGGLEAALFPGGVTWAHVVAWLGAGLVAALVGAGLADRYFRRGWLNILIGLVGLAGGVTGAVLLTASGAGFWTVVICTPLVGAAFGALNGLIIARTGLQPFIVTLAMMILIVGVARFVAGGGGRVHNVFSEETTPAGAVTKPGAPRSFLEIGLGRLITVEQRGRDGEMEEVGLIPVPGLIMLGAWIVAAIVLQRTATGRHVYAVGGNEEAARLSGVPTQGVKVFVYSVSGLLAGVAGMIYVARFVHGTPTAGQMGELDAIAAVVIGGTSLMGGRGSILGTLVGVLIFGYLSNILNLKAVSSEMQDILKGVIIIGAASVQAGGFGALFGRLRQRG